MPPALVASTPPIWQLPSEARLKGNRRPAVAATCWACASTSPASTVMVLEAEIDVAHAVEPLERDHDLMAGLERDLPADQPGIAALRHDGRLGLVGEFQDRRDLSRFAGLEHQRRLAAIAVAPFDQIGRHAGFVANGVLLADDAGKRLDGVLARLLMRLVACHEHER